MDDPWLRMRVLANVVIPLIFFMASVYLALHVVAARFVTSPDSPLLWFFSVVTRPLTRPVAALLPTGTPDRRVRLVSLAVYAGLWIAARVILTATVAGAR